MGKLVSDGRVQSAERIPTDQIAVIGDLPASIVMLPEVDLRAGGKRAVWMLGIVGAAAAGALAGLAFTINSLNQPTGVHLRSDDVAVAVPVAAAQPAPAPAPAKVEQPKPQAPVRTIAKQPVRATQPARAVQPVRVAQPAPAKQAAPSTEAPVAVPAELQTDDDRCDQASCAAHGNERECCAPFRVQQVAKLERAQIGPVLASLKSKALDCRSTEGEGLVKIAVDVHSDGSVSHAMVLESPESSVGECVARVVRGAQFPVTDQGGSFVYRLDLAAR